MTGARPSLARGLNKSFAKSRGCYNASANFAPAGRRLKVSGAEASELDARCHSSPIYLFIQVCFRKKGKKTNHLSQTPLLPPLGLFPRHRPGGGGGGVCISAGFSSMHDSRLVALLFSGDKEGAGASRLPDRAVPWAGSVGGSPPQQPFAGRCRTGWQELPLPARCLNRGETKPPVSPAPASTPPSTAGKLWELKHPSREAWSLTGLGRAERARRAPGRAGIHRSARGRRKHWGSGLYPWGCARGSFPGPSVVPDVTERPNLPFLHRKKGSSADTAGCI